MKILGVSYTIACIGSLLGEGRSRGVQEPVRRSRGQSRWSASTGLVVPVVFASRDTLLPGFMRTGWITCGIHSAGE